MNSFDLEERTVRFAEDVIDLCKELNITPLNRRIIDQLIGSSGSIGAKLNINLLIIECILNIEY